MKDKPIRTALPRVERNAAKIDAALARTIRSLVGGQSPWPLLLTGPAGTGKTCAALCLLDLAGGDYFTAIELCEKVIDCQQGRTSWYNTESGTGGVVTPEMFFNQVGRKPLAVLDEIGCRDKVTDAHYDAVKRCIDARSYKPFVVISNHDLAHITKLYDDRIASRLALGTVIELTGRDRRLEN